MDETAELLNTWVETARDYAIFLVDPTGQVASWNMGAERILGYTEVEILGRPLAIFFTPEDRAAGIPEQELAQAGARGRASDDRWHLRQDGSRFWCNGMLMAVRDAQGALRGFVKVMRDLTERKQMEDQLRARAEELQEADRRKNEFLAMLAHELRNPLAPLLTALHVLRGHCPTENPVVEQARGIIERQILKLKRLIDDLLDVARMEMNRIPIQVEPVDLTMITARAAEDVRPLIGDRRQELTVTTDPGPIALMADSVRLEQAIANLLTNAAKFTDPGGHIWLTTQRQGDQAVVRVRDNGIGIAPELLDRAFDLFIQAAQGLDRARGGLGIGLTLARSLVQLHGGTIEARSEGAGRGSEFIVRLPLAPTEASRPAPAPAPGDATPAGVAARVLIVDDNADAARSLGLLLKQTGYQVELAHDGPTGLTMIRTHQPDVVVLDIGLPLMDGYQVARAVRSETAIPLIALTGYGPDEGTSALFDRYLVKPVDPGELVKILRELIPAPTRS
ncbi:MAG TPA: ATP-binding protein [Isosphaeraceae bacterium]|nr:ATP-binding protein [Isosphaeraceae bacterium]